MIAVSGIWRSGTRWLSHALAVARQTDVVGEPFNLSWHRTNGPDYSKAFLSAWEDCRQFRDRLPSTVVDEGAHERLLGLYRQLVEEYPRDVGVVRPMRFLYWSIMREVWSDLRLVYLKRDPYSWLESAAHHEGARGEMNQTPGQWCESLGRRLAAQLGLPERLHKPFWWLLAHEGLLRLHRETLASELGEAALVVPHRRLVDGDLDWWGKLLDHVGLPHESLPRLLSTIQRLPTERTWPSPDGWSKDDMRVVGEAWHSLAPQLREVTGANFLATVEERFLRSGSVQ